LAPVLLAVVVLTIGRMMAQPFVNELIVAYGGKRLAGSYFGAFNLVSGLLAVGLASAVGAAVDRAGGPLAWWPAALCASTGFAAAAGVAILHWGGHLPTRKPEESIEAKVSVAISETDSRDPQ
jgi:hypothetical protein